MMRFRSALANSSTTVCPSCREAVNREWEEAFAKYVELPPLTPADITKLLDSYAEKDVKFEIEKNELTAQLKHLKNQLIGDEDDEL